MLEVLHAERFWDTAPASVYATLLNEGSYLASVATMYRLLRQRGETGDRRRHATHPPRVKPELLATKPNQCWSWDIERHEASLDRAVVKGHRLQPVAAGW
jgi:putative transposase